MMKLNKENLVKFELEFFYPTKNLYKNLRYGQAICEEFHDVNCNCELFYIQDISYARALVWQEIKEEN